MIVALLVRLPSDVAAHYLEQAFARQMPGYRLAITEVVVSPLLRLRAGSCRVSAVGVPAPVLQVEDVSVEPSLWGFCLGRKEVGFSAKAYGGKVRGDVLLRAGSLLPEVLSVELTRVQLQRYANLKNLLGRQLAGEVSGDVVFSGGAGRFVDGSGRAEVTLRNGEVELLQPILGFASLGLEEVAVALAIEKRKATVKRFDLESREGHGTISGFVNIQDNILQSRLSLRGDVEPDVNAFRGRPDGERLLKVMKPFLRNGKIRIGVSGTFTQPRIRLL